MKIIKFTLWLFVLTINLNAQVSIQSKNGNSLIFKGKEKNEHYEANLYKELIFSSKDYNSTIYNNGAMHYYEPKDNVFSPTGRYAMLDAVEGGYIFGYSKNDKPLWSERGHCLIIDMQNGCVLINETSEACVVEWEGDELYYTGEEQKQKIELKSDIKDGLDQLFDCENIGFMDTKECKEENKSKIDNVIRCNALDVKTISKYEKYMSKDSDFKHKELLKQSIVTFISSFRKVILKDKTYLYLKPSKDSLTKAYLIKGDEIRILKESEDTVWQKIAYIDKNSKILIRWVKNIK